MTAVSEANGKSFGFNDPQTVHLGGWIPGIDLRICLRTFCSVLPKP